MSIQELTTYPSVKLSKLLTALENGSRPAGGVGQVSKGVPSLGGEHIANDGKFDFENIKYVPDDFFAQMSRGIIQKLDVLVVKDGATTGKTVLVGDDFPFERAAINEHVFIVRPDTELLLPEYLFFFLFSQWGQAQMAREFHGGAIGGINQSFAEHLEIPLPPQSEQRRIANILRQADSLRKLRQDTMQMGKKLHAKFFEWYFGNGVSLENHEVVKLESLLTTGLSSGYSPSNNDDPSGIPIFNLSALTDYGLDERQLKYFPAESYDGKGNDLIVDDLLISRSNTLEFVGRVGRYKGFPSNVIYPDTMIRIRVSDHVDAIYLEHFLRSPYMRAVITQRARGTSGSMKKISQADINEFQVLLPSKSEREAFAQAIEALEEQENRYVVSFQKIKMLFQAITARAFTGELTKSWRKGRRDELQRAAAEQNKKVGFQNEIVIVSDDTENKFALEQENLFVEKFPSLLGVTLNTKKDNVVFTNASKYQVMELAKTLMSDENFSSIIRSAKEIPNQKAVEKCIQDSVNILDPSLFNFLSRISHSSYISSSLLQMVNAPIEKYAQAIAEHILVYTFRAIEKLKFEKELGDVQLSPKQKVIFEIVQVTSGYFDAESLCEQHDILLQDVRSALELFQALGLVAQISLLTSPTGTGEVYVPKYRYVRTGDSSRANDLAALGLKPKVGTG